MGTQVLHDSPLPNGASRTVHHPTVRGGGCSGGLKGHGDRTGQDRRPPGRRPFRDPRRSRELGRQWRSRGLGRPWRISPRTAGLGESRVTTSMSWRGGKKSNKNWIKTAKQNGGRASLTFRSAVLSGVRGDEGARRQGYPKYTGFNQHRITGKEDIQSKTKKTFNSRQNSMENTGLFKERKQRSKQDD